MRVRPSSRLLILDSTGRVLLFRFVHLQGVLAGQDFWATPGGGLEDSETFEQAAIRELAEETGIHVNNVGPEISRREVEFQLPDGEHVISDERYFMIRVDDLPALSRDGWTALEAEVMADWRWWSAEELALTSETVWPENLLAMLSEAAARQLGTLAAGSQDKNMRGILACHGSPTDGNQYPIEEALNGRLVRSGLASIRGGYHYDIR